MLPQGGHFLVSGSSHPQPGPAFTFNKLNRQRDGAVPAPAPRAVTYPCGSSFLDPPYPEGSMVRNVAHSYSGDMTTHQTEVFGDVFEYSDYRSMECGPIAVPSVPSCIPTFCRDKASRTNAEPRAAWQGSASPMALPRQLTEPEPRRTSDLELPGLGSRRSLFLDQEPRSRSATEGRAMSSERQSTCIIASLYR